MKKGTIKTKEQIADLDFHYGPYTSVEIAKTTMDEIAKSGRQFIVEKDGTTELYMYQGKNKAPKKLEVVVSKVVNILNTDSPVSSEAVANYSIQKVDTVEDLRKTKGQWEGQVVELLGYYTAGEYSLKYKWRAVQSPDDGGSIINPTTGGSWVAQFGEMVMLSPKYFGAKVGGVEDCTNAFNKIIDLGKIVDVSNSTYRITSIDRADFKIFGYNYNLSKIITAPTNSEKIVFTNPRTGTVTGVYFEPTTADQQILFKRGGAFSCRIKDNYFKEYHTVFDFQVNGNSMYIQDNYFYRGLYGVRAVLAHACYINNNMFRQQKVFSLDLQSGTGSDTRSNHFMGAIGMPATIRMLGMQTTFEDNYYEAYEGIIGELNEVAIIIEFNYISHMPVFRNNRFNLKGLFKYGVEFVGGSTVNQRYIDWNKNAMDGFTVSMVKGNGLQNFRNINIRESLGYASFTRHGFRAVNVMDLTTVGTAYKKVDFYNSNIVIENGSKSLLETSNFKPTYIAPDVKYLLKIKLNYSTTVENSGIILSYRRAGVTPTMIEISEPTIVTNKIVEMYYVITGVVSAAEYFIDYRTLTGHVNIPSIITEVDFSPMLDQSVPPIEE